MPDKDWGKRYANFSPQNSAISQHTVENEYDKYLLPNIDQGQVRARQQGLGGELFNGVSAALVKVIPNIIGNTASILDYEDYLNQDDEVGNFVTSKMQELTQHIDNFLPVYEKNPGEALSFGDSAWWVKNMSQVLGSGVEFALTGAGVAGVLGKSLQLVGATGKIGNGLNVVGTAVTLNQAEAIISAQEVYKSTYELNIKKGLSEDEAKQIAANSAAYTININRLNLPLNLTSAALFTRTPKLSRVKYNDITRATTLKRFGLEGGQEYGEEIINHVAQKEGERSGEGKGYNVYNTLDDVFSAEGVEAGLLGFLGGVVQTGATEALNEFNGKNDYEREGAAKQKADWEFNEGLINTVSGNAKLKDILDSVAVQSSYQNKIYEADLANNAGESKRLREGLLQYQALNAFKNGSTESLLTTFDEVSKDPNGETKYGKDYGVRAIEAKKKILDWEDRYNDYISKFDDTRGEHVFNNSIERDTLREESISLARKKQLLEAQIVTNRTEGLTTTVEEQELANLLVEEKALSDRKAKNAGDLITILDDKFNPEEYSRKKIEGVTGKPLSKEAHTAKKLKEQLEKQSPAIDKYKPLIEGAKSLEELDTIAQQAKQDGVDLSQGLLTSIANKRDELTPKPVEIVKQVEDKDATPSNPTVKLSSLKPGQKVKVNGVEYTVQEGKKANWLMYSGSDEDAKKFMIFTANNATTTGEDIDLPIGEAPSPLDTFNKVVQDLNSLLKEVEGASSDTGLNERLESTLRQLDPVREDLKLNKFFRDRILKLRGDILAAIEGLSSKGAANQGGDDTHIDDNGISQEDIASEFNYKSHTAFRTTDQMFEEAVKKGDKDSIRWQNFVNRVKPQDASKYRLKVVLPSDSEYNGLRTPIQKEYEDRTGKTGILIVLTDQDGEYIKVDDKPLTTVLLKNEDFEQHGKSVDKVNMAKKMGIPLDRQDLIDDAYNKMWEDTRAFRERLLAGEVKSLQVNGMGKGVPVREEKPIHSILGRITNDPNFDDIGLYIGSGDYIVGKGFIPYKTVDGYQTRAGVLYAVVDGEYIPLVQRPLNSKEINHIVDQFSKLTQGDVNLNNSIEEEVKKYVFLTTNPDKMTKEARTDKSLFIKGNTIYYGKEGKVNSNGDLTDLRKFLLGKVRQADVNLINHSDKKVRVEYRKFLFEGDKPAFTTDRLKIGELGRVNNYFTYEVPSGDTEIKRTEVKEVKEVAGLNPYANVPRATSKIVNQVREEKVDKPVTSTPLLTAKERKLFKDNDKVIKIVTTKVYREMNISPEFSKEGIEQVIKSSIDNGATTLEEVIEAVTNYCKK